MTNLSDQVKINLNQNLWGLLVAFATLGTSERYNLPVLFWFSIFASLIMTLSIAVTTTAYTMTYWKKKADGPSSVHPKFGSITGWRRLWILCSIIAIFPIAYSVIPAFPTTAAANETRLLESIEATESFLAQTQVGYKPLGAQAVRTGSYADLSSEEIVLRLYGHYKGKVDFSEIDERHKARLMRLGSDQMRIAASTIGIWGVFSVLLLAFGILLRWVYHGFREPTI